MAYLREHAEISSKLCNDFALEIQQILDTPVEHKNIQKIDPVFSPYVANIIEEWRVKELSKKRTVARFEKDLKKNPGKYERFGSANYQDLLRNPEFRKIIEKL